MFGIVVLMKTLRIFSTVSALVVFLFGGFLIVNGAALTYAAGVSYSVPAVIKATSSLLSGLFLVSLVKISLES